MKNILSFPGDTIVQSTKKQRISAMNMRPNPKEFVLFQPTNKFIRLLQRTGKPVVDCGAGSGFLGRVLSAHSIPCLSIDLISHENVLRGDATKLVYPHSCLPLICRPSPGDWIVKTIQRVSQFCGELWYVGLQKNVELDLGTYFDRATRLMGEAGKEDESVWAIDCWK